MNADRAGEQINRQPASSPRGRMAETPRASLLAFGLLLAGATAGVFLAGGPPQGSLGIFLVCAGAALTFCPPQVKVAWPLWLAAAALVGCGALAFLPENWFGVPAWRRTLEAAPAIHLPATITTVPRETGFWLALLALSLLIGLFLLTQPVRSHWLLLFSLLAALAAGTYGVLAIYASETGWHYPFASDATFGFFPNRNHTATLLFVGSLLALGVLTVVLREGRWLVGLLAAGIVTVCVVALGFFSVSRGGVVFLLVGVVLWLAGLGRRHGDPRLWVSLCSLLLAGAVLFVVSGSEVRNRLLGRAEPAPVATDTLPAALPMALAPPVRASDAMHNFSADLRLKIYRDACAAIRDFPLTGMGLGSFALVFPQYRRASLIEAAAIHPESDWLLLAAEAGLPAVLCVLALVGLAARRLRFEWEHPYWPMRWGCAVAAGAAALHGMVDVPLHRVNLGWWVLVVAGLALQSTRASTGGRSRGQHALFIVGGVFALALGGALVRAQWFGGPSLPPFAVEQAPLEIFQAYHRKDYPAATGLARRTIQNSPLFAPAYFYLGVLLALSDEEGTDARVDTVFHAQRLLDPVSPEVPLQEADAWAGYDPARQVTLWLEALSRIARIREAEGGAFPRTLDYYRELVRRAAGQPDTQRYLLSAARPDPRFASAWSQSAPELAGPLAASLAADAAAHPAIVPGWYARGEGEAPQGPSPEPGEWQVAAWPVRLRQSVYAGQFARAVGEVAGRYGISLALPGEGPAANRPEGDDPTAAFEQAWRAGDTVTARRLLDAALVDPGQPGSLEWWRWRAAVAAHDGNWQAAWETLERYVRHTRQTEWP